MANQDIIMFIQQHFDDIIDEKTYLFVKELHEYVSLLYEGDYSDDEISSDEEFNENGVEEHFEVNVDEDGFLSLK